MAVEYDLVVVGNNAAATLAAIAAKERSARVAYIAVAPPKIPHHLFLSQWTQLPPDQRHSLGAWTQAMTLNWQMAHSPAQLANLGIEQLQGKAQFHPHLQVGNRRLRSHRYLLSLDAELSPPNYPGLTAAPWLSPATLLQQIETLPPSPDHTILVVGNGPIAIILSQAVARLGYAVSLLTEQAQLLPWEDAEAAFRLQAHLEAEGVQIFRHCQIKAVRQTTESLTQVVTNFGVLSGAFLVGAMEPTSTTINPQLVAVDLRHCSQGLWTNPHLQTSSPHIYACGSVLGGYTLADVAQHEALVAVRNALSRRQTAIDYCTIPWSIQTTPALARVGMTEQQVQQQNRPFQVVYPVLDQTAQGRLQDPGWSKFMIQTNGQILGAHIIGPAAAETIHGVAIAMQQHCPITALADSAAFSSSYSSMIGQVARQWSSTCS